MNKAQKITMILDDLNEVSTPYFFYVSSYEEIILGDAETGKLQRFFSDREFQLLTIEEIIKHTFDFLEAWEVEINDA